MSWLPIVIYFCAAWAEGPMVFQELGMTDDEYAAQMRAHTDYRSPIDAYIQSRPSAANKRALLDKYADAQMAFVRGDMNLAQKLLNEVVEMRVVEDWSPAERRVLFHASLRLAQMAQGDEAERGHVEMALSIDSTMSPDKSLFPPPLLKKLEDLRQALPPISISSKVKTGGWKAVLINGQRCDQAGCPPLFKSDRPSRWTWLSNSYQPVTTVEPVNDSLKAPPPVDLITREDCQTIADSKACRAVAVDFNPRPAKDPSLSLFTPKKPAKSVLKSPWVWAGVGVALAIFIANQNRKSEDREPSTTYGF